MPFKQRQGKHVWLSTAWSQQREEDVAQRWQWAVYSRFHKLLGRRKHDVLTTTNITNITYLFFYLQLFFSNRGRLPWQQCRAHLTLFLIQFFVESLRGRVSLLSLEYDSMCDAIYTFLVCWNGWILPWCSLYTISVHNLDPEAPGTAYGCHGREERRVKDVRSDGSWWVLTSRSWEGEVSGLPPAPVKHWFPFLPTPPFSVVVVSN